MKAFTKRRLWPGRAHSRRRDGHDGEPGVCRLEDALEPKWARRRGSVSSAGSCRVII